MPAKLRCWMACTWHCVSGGHREAGVRQMECWPSSLHCHTSPGLNSACCRGVCARLAIAAPGKRPCISCCASWSACVSATPLLTWPVLLNGKAALFLAAGCHMCEPQDSARQAGRRCACARCLQASSAESCMQPGCMLGFWQHQIKTCMAMTPSQCRRRFGSPPTAIEVLMLLTSL